MNDINELAAALALAQAEMTNATLNKINPAFKSRYADLAAIREATLPALNKHGLALIQTTDFLEGGLFLTTRLVHKSGQSITGSYPLPVADKPQVMGSALTYARRYAWASMCGITADDDDDADAASKAKPNGNGNGNVAPQAGAITAEQAKTIRNAIKEVDADEHLFVKYLKVTSLDQLPAAQYQRALEALASKRGKTQ